MSDEEVSQQGFDPNDMRLMSYVPEPMNPDNPADEKLDDSKNSITFNDNSPIHYYKSNEKIYPRPIVLDKFQHYKTFTSIPTSTKLEFGQLYNGNFQRARGIFNKNTQKMSGLVTFFRFCKYSNLNDPEEQILTVVDMEGEFKNGKRFGLFKKYLYDFVNTDNFLKETMHSSYKKKDHFFNVIYESGTRTLRSKSYIEHIFINDKEVSGPFKQNLYCPKTRKNTLIQGYKNNGALTGSYAVFLDRILIERGDSRNLLIEKKLTLENDKGYDPIYNQVNIKPNIDDFSTNQEAGFIWRAKFEGEGSYLFINRKTKFMNSILHGQPLIRRFQIGQALEETILYALNNRISFVGKSKGYFMTENSNNWIMTEGNGITYDKFGRSVYNGVFKKCLGQDINLENGVYKSFDNNGNLQKVERYYNNSVNGMKKIYSPNGKLCKITKENFDLKENNFMEFNDFVVHYNKFGGFEYFGAVFKDKYNGYGIKFQHSRPIKRGEFNDNKLNSDTGFLYDNKTGKLSYFGNFTMGEITGPGIQLDYTARGKLIGITNVASSTRDLKNSNQPSKRMPPMKEKLTSTRLIKDSDKKEAPNPVNVKKRMPPSKTDQTKKTITLKKENSSDKKIKSGKTKTTGLVKKKKKPKTLKAVKKEEQGNLFIDQKIAEDQDSYNSDEFIDDGKVIILASTGCSSKPNTAFVQSKKVLNSDLSTCNLNSQRRITDDKMDVDVVGFGSQETRLQGRISGGTLYNKKVQPIDFNATTNECYGDQNFQERQMSPRTNNTVPNLQIPHRRMVKTEKKDCSERDIKGKNVSNKNHSSEKGINCDLGKILVKKFNVQKDPNRHGTPQYLKEHISKDFIVEDPRLSSQVKEFFIENEWYDVIWENSDVEKSEVYYFKNIAIPTQEVDMPEINNWEQWGKDFHKEGTVGWKGYFQTKNQKYQNLHIHNFQIDFNGHVMGNGTDEDGDYIICGSMIESHADIEFIKQYRGAHSVFFKGKIVKGRIVGRWSYFENNMIDEFMMEMITEVRLCGHTVQVDTRQNIEGNFVFNNSGIFGIGYDPEFNDSFLILGVYNPKNGLIHFAKKYFTLVNTQINLVISLGIAYQSLDSPDIVTIEGYQFVPEHGYSAKRFYLKTENPIPLEEGMSGTSNGNLPLNAPQQGKYKLSNNREGSFWENPNNQIPTAAKIYKRGENQIQGFCSILKENLFGRLVQFANDDTSLPFKTIEGNRVLNFSGVIKRDYYVIKCEFNYNAAGKKSGWGKIYHSQNLDPRIIKCKGEVYRPTDYIEQFYLNNKPNGHFRMVKYNKADQDYPSLLIVGKKKMSKPIGFYKVYEDMRQVETGDAKNFKKFQDIDMYNYDLDRKASSEEFLMTMNQKRTNLTYRNFQYHYYVIFQNSKLAVLKKGADMFDFEKIFQFNTTFNKMSFYGTANWNKNKDGDLQINERDGANFDVLGRLFFEGTSVWDKTDPNNLQDGYFREFHYDVGRSLKGVGWVEDFKKPYLRKIYHKNGKLANIAVQNCGVRKLDLDIEGSFCQAFDEKGMFKYAGGVENGILKGDKSVVWDTKACRVKKGHSSNIELPIWVFDNEKDNEVKEKRKQNLNLMAKNGSQMSQQSEMSRNTNFGHDSGIQNDTIVRQINAVASSLKKPVKKGHFHKDSSTSWDDIQSSLHYRR